jgi:hypothetical protein
MRTFKPLTCISFGEGDASFKACCRTGAVGSAAHPCAATRYHPMINLDRPVACGRGDSGDLDPLGCRCARRSLPSRIRRAVAHRQCGADAGLKGHLVRDSQLEATGALPLLADARLPSSACRSARTCCEFGDHVTQPPRARIADEPLGLLHVGFSPLEWRESDRQNLLHRHSAVG